MGSRKRGCSSFLDSEERRRLSTIGREVPVWRGAGHRCAGFAGANSHCLPGCQHYRYWNAAQRLARTSRRKHPESARTMGLLDIFKSKPTEAARPELPSGSFTVDRNGQILSSTISSRFPRENLNQISEIVLRAFAGARNADIQVTELNVKLGAMNVRAVEMRGGAMIFLSPRGERPK